MKTKLSLHAFSPIHAKSIIANHKDLMDKIIIGNNDFGLRQVANFSVDDIEVVTNFAHNFNVKCYVSANKLFHDEQLDDLVIFLKKLDALQVDGVIFSDLAVAYCVQNNNLNLNLIYSTETTITNGGFTTYANQNGFEGIEVAKEITAKEINEIAATKQSKVMVQIHGHLYMYQSIRKMIDNFSEFQNDNMHNDNMHLFDSERNKYYPLIQNEQGTHILASNNLAMIHKLDKLNINEIDSLRIDPLLYTPIQYNQIVKLYSEALNMINDSVDEYQNNAQYYLQKLKTIKEDQKYSTGFFFKNTMF